MDVFLESVGDLSLVTRYPSRVSRLSLIAAAWSSLMEISLVDHLRGNLLFVMIVLLLGVAVVSFNLR